jgi:hypothetical protein
MRPRVLGWQFEKKPGSQKKVCWCQQTPLDGIAHEIGLGLHA